MPETKQLLRKIPGGKLLRISCVVDDAVIRQISIRGDFFMYPEEAVYDIESSLTGLPLDTEILRKRIDETAAEKNIEITGFSAQDLAETITGEHQ